MNICIETEAKCIDVMRELDVGSVSSARCTFVIAQEDFENVTWDWMKGNLPESVVYSRYTL